MKCCGWKKFLIWKFVAWKIGYNFVSCFWFCMENRELIFKYQGLWSFIAQFFNRNVFLMLKTWKSFKFSLKICCISLNKISTLDVLLSLDSEYFKAFVLLGLIINGVNRSAHFKIFKALRFFFSYKPVYNSAKKIAW